MAVVVENGTVVAAANSYITVATARDYATARGVTLDPSDAVVEQLILHSMTYLESLRYVGARTAPDVQELSWPRYGAVVDGREFLENQIPPNLIKAQCQIVMEQAQGVSLFKSQAAGAAQPFVKREKVSVIETEYATPKDGADEARATATMPVVDALLRGLVRVGGLMTYRI